MRLSDLFLWCFSGLNIENEDPDISLMIPTPSFDISMPQIPVLLQDIPCHTLQDIATFIKIHFHDYTSVQVILAIKFFKDYIENNFNWIFIAPIIISLPHKTDQWKNIIGESDFGTYLVISKLDNLLCLYRQLICIKDNQIYCLERKMLHTLVPSHLITTNNIPIK